VSVKVNIHLFDNDLFLLVNSKWRRIIPRNLRSIEI